MTLAVEGKIGLSGWPSGERLLLFSEVGSQSRAEGLLLQMCWILLAPLVHEVTPLFSCSPQIRKWPLDKSTTRLLGYLIRRWLFIFGSPKVLLLTIGQRQHCLSDALFCMSKCHWDRNASNYLFVSILSQVEAYYIMSLILLSKRFWYLFNLLFVIFSEKIKGHV